MNSLGKAFAYLIAMQFNALGLMFAAWLFGEYLNREYPQSFNWMLVTFLIALLGLIQSSYVIIRKALQVSQPATKEAEPAKTDQKE